MRTTLDIEDEMLTHLKLLAAQQGTSLGQVVSALARQSLPKTEAAQIRNGIRLLPLKNPGAVSNLEIVNALREDE